MIDSHHDKPVMTTYKLVMPEHLNQFGFLFGGNLLKWVDETGWMAASHDYPGHRFVTVGLDRVEFREGAGGGHILRFDVHYERSGQTSVSYHVHVCRQDLETGRDLPIFTTTITFVRVDAQGNKHPLGASRRAVSPEVQENRS